MYDNVPADCWYRKDAPWLDTEDDIYVCPSCGGLHEFYEREETEEQISVAEWEALPPSEQEHFYFCRCLDC
jgi:hypothetical protein